MKHHRYLSILTAGSLLLCLLSGCGDPKTHLDFENTPTMPSFSRITPATEPVQSPAEPITDPAPTEDPFVDTEYLSRNAKEGIYVLVSEKTPLANDYQYQLADIKSSFGDAPIQLRQYTMLLNPIAIVALKQLCTAFYDTFGTDARYQPLIQNAYDPTDRTSEHATGYALDLRFWDTEKKLVYNPGDNVLAAEAEFIQNHLTECGFILRYPDDPGHIRYIGPTLALALQEAGMTFDSFVSAAMSCTYKTPLTLSSYQAYCVAASDKMTTQIPLPRNVTNYLVTGLNNRYFLILIPQNTPTAAKGSDNL